MWELGQTCKVTRRLGFSRFEEMQVHLLFLRIFASGVPTLAAYVVGTKLVKMTGQIRKTAAKEAMKQLQDEGLVLTGEAVYEYKLEIEGLLGLVGPKYEGIQGGGEVTGPRGIFLQ